MCSRAGLKLALIAATAILAARPDAALLPAALGQAQEAVPNVSARVPGAGAENFFEAVKIGNLATVKELLKANPELLQARTPEGFSVLIAAVYSDRKEIADYMLSLKPPQDVFEAAVTGNVERVKELVAANPDAENAFYVDGWSALHEAAFYGQPRVVEFLLAHGANVDARSKNEFRNTPLLSALMGKNENLASAKALIAAGADVNVRHGEGWTPLHHAAMSGFTQLLQPLLDHGANLDARDAKGRTPIDAARAENQAKAVELLEAQKTLQTDFFDAVGEGDAAKVRELLEHNPGLASARHGENHATALHRAAAKGHAELAELLLARGADVNAREKGDNAIPLHFAADGGHLEAARVLVEHGSKIDVKDDDHEAGPLGWCTCIGALHRDVAEYLISKGAKPNIFSAVALGNAEMARTLVKANRQVVNTSMSRFENHQRPLHLAIRRQLPEMIKLLLECGADANVLTDLGISPLALAAAWKMEGVVKLLQASGGKLDLSAALALGQFDQAEAMLKANPECLKPGNPQNQLIYFAIQEGTLEMLTWLLDHGADPNTYSLGWGHHRLTPMHMAISEGRPETQLDVISLLLKRGADLSLKDSRYNGTPRGWAEYLHRNDILDLIRAQEAKNRDQSEEMKKDF